MSGTCVEYWKIGYRRYYSTGSTPVEQVCMTVQWMEVYCNLHCNTTSANITINNSCKYSVGYQFKEWKQKWNVTVNYLKHAWHVCSLFIIFMTSNNLTFFILLKVWNNYFANVFGKKKKRIEKTIQLETKGLKPQHIMKDKLLSFLRS